MIDTSILACQLLGRFRERRNQFDINFRQSTPSTPFANRHFSKINDESCNPLNPTVNAALCVCTVTRLSRRLSSSFALLSLPANNLGALYRM